MVAYVNMPEELVTRLEALFNDFAAEFAGHMPPLEQRPDAAFSPDTVYGINGGARMIQALFRILATTGYPAAAMMLAHGLGSCVYEIDPSEDACLARLEWLADRAFGITSLLRAAPPPGTPAPDLGGMEPEGQA